MVGYLGSKPIVLFIDPAQDTAQAFRDAYIRLHNFSVQVSKHKAAHGTSDHQPWAHPTLGEIPGYFDADKSGGTRN